MFAFDGACDVHQPVSTVGPTFRVRRSQRLARLWRSSLAIAVAIWRVCSTVASSGESRVEARAKARFDVDGLMGLVEEQATT